MRDGEICNEIFQLVNFFETFCGHIEIFQEKVSLFKLLKILNSLWQFPIGGILKPSGSAGKWNGRCPNAKWNCCCCPAKDNTVHLCMWNEYNYENIKSGVRRVKTKYFLTCYESFYEKNLNKFFLFWGENFSAAQKAKLRSCKMLLRSFLYLIHHFVIINEKF